MDAVRIRLVKGQPLMRHKNKGHFPPHRRADALQRIVDYQQVIVSQGLVGLEPLEVMGSFDLFRAPASKDAAIAYQDRYRETVVEPYMANDPKIMQTWASREGELDLDDPKIWTQYYNKPEDYHALREIKRKLDPDDLFHSKFTLRPAEH